MQQEHLIGLLVLEKKKYRQLVEVQDLTKQLAEAVDRNDPTSARMLVSMRQDPIEQLEQIQRNLATYHTDLPEPDRIRAEALLRGEQAQRAEEQDLAAQVASNRRLLQQILELDHRVSRKMGGNDSYYMKDGKKPAVP